jgi:hypothetical protein
MAFVVSTLTDYAKENEALLVTSSVLGSKTATLIKSQGNVLVGVKSSEKIGIMDTDAFFQDDSDCGFNASGTTTFTQRSVTVGKIKVQEALCPKGLESKYLQKALSAGSMYDSIAFAADYTSRKSAKIASQLETAIWQGDSASANGNLNKFDGFAKLVAAASASVIHANASGYYGSPLAASAGITSGVVVAVIDAVYKAIPAQIVDKDDVAIFVGNDVFRTYTIALKNSNLFNYTFDGQATGELTLPGTTIKVIAVQGLNGTSKIYAGRISNLFIGTDLLNEEEQFELLHDPYAMNIKFMAAFKFGVQFAFPDEMVDFIPTA